MAVVTLLDPLPLPVFANIGTDSPPDAAKIARENVIFS